MEELVKRLISSGVRIRTSGGDVFVRYGQAGITEADQDGLKKIKTQLISAFPEMELSRLSWNQENLWFLSQLEEQKPVGHTLRLEMRGMPDKTALGLAIDHVLAVHESLRTVFLQVQDFTVQAVRASMKVELRETDLTGLAEDARKTAAENALAEMAEVPVDLENNSPIKFQLVKIREDLHYLDIFIHLVAADRAGVNIILADLAAAYNAQTVSKTETGRLTGTGFAVWQKDQEQTQAFRQKVEEQREELQDISHPGIIPDFPNAGRLVHKTEKTEIRTAANKNLLLTEFAEKYQVHTDVICLAGVYLLLSRYGRQDSLCLGFPEAGRDHTALRQMAGPLENMLVIQIRASRETDTLEDLIRQIDSKLKKARAGSLPDAALLKSLHLSREHGKLPLYQVVVDCRKEVKPDLSFKDLATELLQFNTVRPGVDLYFRVPVDSRNCIQPGFLEYNAEIFARGTAENLSAQYGEILEDLPDYASTPLKDIPPARKEGINALLQKWNHNPKELPSDSIPALISATAEKDPGATAVIFNGKKLSYAELDQQSNLFAAVLQQNGVKPGHHVGIGLERSLEMIPAILGILKAGAAYVPLDPGYPEERLKFIIGDTAICHLITDERSAPDFKKAIGDHVTCLMAKHMLQSSVTFSPVIIDQDNPAYIIYTSGSTGKPKGVIVNHGNMVNHHLSVIDIYQLTPADNVMQFSTMNFDIFVEEVFPTLVIGASLVILDPVKYLDPVYIKEITRSENITVVNWPTAFWQSIAEEDYSDTPLRISIIGGQKAESGYLQKWFAHNPGVRKINAYGPTETTVTALQYDIPIPLTSETIPVGKPLHNTMALVVDEYMNLLPPGMPGELLIAGKGVAAGYLNSEDLTRKAFISHPYTNQPVYRTGDLVKWSADGEIIFLGRIDKQVKIRGFRIEPGEIENVMLKMPGIEESVVLPRENSYGKFLVAFYTGPNRLREDALRKHIGESLPDYMIPPVFIYLNRMPITPNGKTDKKELALMEIDGETTETARIPTTSPGREIAEAWKQVLKKETVSMREDFFGSGGSSVMFASLVSLVNDTLNLKLNLAEQYRKPVLEHMINSASITQSHPKQDTETETELLEF